MMFDLTAEEARLLLNVALMAVGRNRFRSAAKILSVLERFRPDAPSVAVAKAIALISAEKFGECVAFVDGEALARFPENGMLLAFRGMALLRLNRVAEARESLERARKRTDDPAAAQLAAGLLSD